MVDKYGREIKKFVIIHNYLFVYCSGLDGVIPCLLIENDIFSEIGWGRGE
jgi:hypothetical protein